MSSICNRNSSESEQEDEEDEERPPEYEALESMTLLSAGMTAVAQQVEVLARKPKFPNPLELLGTLHGTVKANNHTHISLWKASGNLSPVGHMSFTARLLPGQGLTMLKLSSDVGRLFVTIGVESYTITGGNGRLRGETGSGGLIFAEGTGDHPLRFSFKFVNPL